MFIDTGINLINESIIKAITLKSDGSIVYHIENGEPYTAKYESYDSALNKYKELADILTVF